MSDIQTWTIIGLLATTLVSTMILMSTMLNRTIKAEIGGFRGEMNARFDLVDFRFEQVDKRFEQVDRRFEQVDKRFEQVDRRFEQVDKRFEQVDKRFDKLHEDVQFLYKRFPEL